MSTRALRKKQQVVVEQHVESDNSSNEEEESEEEVVVKQTVKPKFSMLNLSDEDEEEENSDKSDKEEEEEESEEEEEEVVEKKPQIKPSQQEKLKQQQQAAAKKKQAKKKQQKKKNKQQQQKDEFDEFEQLEKLNIIPPNSLRQLSESELKEQEFKNLFKINASLLNPDNELKKLFGCKSSDIKGQKKKSAPHQHNFRKKNYIFVPPKYEWPDMIGLMVMELCNEKTTTTTTTTTNTNSPKQQEIETNNNGVNYFKIKWGETYSNIQEQFYIALTTHDPMNIVEIIRYHPYHIDSLLQLGQVCLQTADYQKAGDFVEMAVFAFECVFHHLFNPINGNCRFEYKHDQNKSCFLAIFRYIQIIGRRACNRTALEFCKILLSWDYSDPLYIRLIIDYYSIRSKQYRFLYDLYSKQKTITPSSESPLSLLPNFCYSAALAMFYIEQDKQLQEKGDESSNSLIQKALISFPMVLKPLLEKLKTNFTIAKSGKMVTLENEPFFKDDPLERRIDHLVQLFIERNHQCWSSPEVLEWLKSNVQIVLDKVKNVAQNPMIKELGDLIKSEYETVNQQVFDHLVLSEYSDVINRLTPDIIEAMHAEGFQDIVPQRDPNQPQLPPQHQRRGGIGNGFQLYQQQQRNQQQQRRVQQQLRNLQQQQQRNQQQPLEPVIQDNPDYNGPANPILNFIHSLLPWNDPSVRAANAQNQDQPAPGFLDDYVDFSDDEENEDQYD